MKLPRNVSGSHFADVLCGRWQYTKVHQIGSHIILETSEPAHQRLAVPAHHPLRLGTLSSILRAVARHKGVPRDALIRTLQSIAGAEPTCRNWLAQLSSMITIWSVLN